MERKGLTWPTSLTYKHGTCLFNTESSRSVGIGIHLPQGTVALTLRLQLFSDANEIVGASVGVTKFTKCSYAFSSKYFKFWHKSPDRWSFFISTRRSFVEGKLCTVFATFWTYPLQENYYRVLFYCCECMLAKGIIICPKLTWKTKVT